MPFQVDTVTGLVQNARYVPSPNHDERPAGMDVELLVIHGISLPAGQFGGPYVEDLFLNRLDLKAHDSFAPLKGLKVSAHLFVRRDGGVIQFVPLNKRAWHAGVSVFQGRERCNDFSIGIEMEGTDEVSYKDAQYDALNELIEAISRAYPGITHDTITGHVDIAPGRKTDPGPKFQWHRIGVIRS